MDLKRRTFLQLAGATACGALGAGALAKSDPPPGDGIGVLVDTTECIGCRKCEFACDRQHNLTGRPLEDFEDFSVFDQRRRMDAKAYTVVNSFPGKSNVDMPVTVKMQCLHCLKPACASACLVRALERQANGAVTYDADKCIGCRYCMVACPFQVPGYEYDNPLTPMVRKCDFCFERVTKENKIPACCEICPPMCLTFGKREELLAVAHAKIAERPDRYVHHIYGEHEVGGTSWLYLAPKEFAALGFPELSEVPVPSLTENIQHNVFKFGLPPLLLYGLLAAAMKVLGEHSHHDDRGATGDAS